MVAALLTACAPRAGWERTDRRTCAADEPPRVCVANAPDRQMVVRVGGATIVPGECVVAPERRGGRLRVAVDDGRTGVTRERSVRVRRGRVTTVALADGRVARTRGACVGPDGR